MLRSHRLVLCAALMLSAAVPALAAPAARDADGGSAPWDTDFLPPVPAWRGASEKLLVKAGDPWATPAELTGLTATPSYDETRAFIDRLVAASPLLRQEVFGVSPEGREMVAVLAAKGLVDGRPDPAKPLLLVQAGIHAGEIDGKDAGLMLLRDITQRGKDGLLDRVNLLFVPIFNVDGHERAGAYNRPNQRGPMNQGWRTTAQNLNLNRDYGKLDTPEMRAMIALIGKYQPDLYLDIHVTDGMDYAYDITFGNDEAPGGDQGAGTPFSPAIDHWLAGPFKAAETEALTKAGHIPGPLVTEVDGRKPEDGITGGTTPLRFSIGYGNLVHIPTVLVENHALKPYRQRVLGTYILIERALTLLADQGAALRQAVASDRARRPDPIPVAFEAEKTPSDTIDFKTMRHEAYLSAASGGTEVRWLGRPGPTVRMPVYGDHPSARVSRPRAYWVPATKPEIIERLRLHGLALETLDQPRDVTVDSVRLVEPKLATEANEGHVMLDKAGYTHETRTVRYPKGSVRVPTDQPLGDLAAALLEAESSESFLAWGFFPEILQRTEYIEPYAIAPLAERMLAASPALKAEFEAKLKADPAFAASPDKRLAWFYERTPYSDAAYLRYPVGREMAGREMGR
ncbi:M14 family metallopeptidase [Nitrospirillum sp. BR 11828]|uniref:M14 family metallopeptidase n=1 Tax=Nitrospirillum sp. BR 11828 TaxID=3104325 RepID=UPI002ACA927B|nr:M14 family metallopeptidase [Nitrospirillum sp. BR 11828]MDZ5646996.1 M14 family metallopeptidase [Nitrospirillum sp. BR 11828]